MFGSNIKGRGRRGGAGLGFRGDSPPWPYTGQGRGGLPRCRYYSGGAAKNAPFASPMSRDQELELLKSEAQTLRDDLHKLEDRIGKLSAEKE